MSEPVWVLDALVPAIHDRQLAEHGGMPGVRDPRMLESALARPRQLWAYDPTVSVERLAAAYAFGIARNHAFIDGNKRVALVVCETFLRLNGRTPAATQVEKHSIFNALAGGDLSEDGVATWLTQNTK